jgi:hypothetical protein
MKNKILSIVINQNNNYFGFSIRKTEKNFILSYKESKDRFNSYTGKDYVFEHVSKLYVYLKDRLIRDGLLTKEDLIVKDIIV